MWIQLRIIVSGMKRALAYLAVTGRGLDEGGELSRQRKVVSHAVGYGDFTVTAFFEEDRSDTIRRAGQRPAFRHLIKSAFAGVGDSIVVECGDQLGDRLEAVQATVGYLEQYGFDVIFCRDPQDSELERLRTVAKESIQAFAQCQKDLFGVRLSGLRQNKKHARVVGTKPYGHYPGERALIKRMRSLRHDGLSYSALAKILNREGVPSRRGKLWHGTTVRKILGRR
jgi:DNA invertase Pin-like site-specific DNA recombinase